MRKVSSPMKRILFIGLGSAMMFAMGGVGSASANGGPHSIPMKGLNTAGIIVTNMGAEQCANCHRAHTAKTGTLTLQAQPAICLNCHGSGGTGSTLNVSDGTQKAVGGLRGGGFDNAVIGTAGAREDTLGSGPYGPVLVNKLIPALTTGQPVTSRHQIDGTTAGTMWGNGTTGVGQGAVTLECGSCHDPHGNGNYRILKASPTGQQYVVTPAVNVGDPVAGGGTAPVAISALMSTATTVNIPDQVLKNYTVVTTRSLALVAAGQATGATPGAIALGIAAANGNYWDVQADTTPLVNATTGLDTSYGAAATSYRGAQAATDGYLGNISAWCTTCHTRYLSGGASSTTGDPTYTYKHRSDEGLSDKPNCIQCHVSHGSNAAMKDAAADVRQPDRSATGLVGSGTVLQTAGDSRLLRIDNRGVCVECHSV